MRITSYGAAESVTGSKHLLEFENGKKLLLDCGLFQGRRKENIRHNRDFPREVVEADAMILSHAHIDHSGAIPILTKAGYKNPIYTTPATRDLCEIMLKDSAHIHEEDAKHLAKKFWPKPEPLYTQEDAELAMRFFEAKPYNEEFSPFEGVNVRLIDAGHILGSAQVEIEFTEGGQTRRLGFTGDLGRKNLPILKDPEQLENLDILITESTYANREHDDIVGMKDALMEVVGKTIQRGGKIIVPAFSVERTQEIVYTLHELHDEGRLREALPVYVDSPLAVNATDIFKKHRECYDRETYEEFIEKGEVPFSMNSLEYVRDVEKSKELNRIDYPCIIISASGMCEAGRIKHHLKNNIGDPKNVVLIVGYQAEGTLGRRLVEKAHEVKIFGRMFPRRCEVVTLNAFSAHAGREELFQNIANSKAKKVVCVHGEEVSLSIFKERIESELAGVEAIVPHEGKSFEV